MSTDDPVDRYPALDALRGAAAFAVLFYHLRSFNAVAEAPPAWQIFASGYLAVDLFFVLSGFVICHAYQSRLLAGLSFGQFIAARFLRLQPVMMAGTLIGFTLAVSQRMMGLPGAPGLAAIAIALPTNLLMLPNVFVPWGIFLFNPPAWSLFYEMLANALYALAVRCRSSGFVPSLSANALGTICLTGYLGVVAAALLEGNLDHGVVLEDWPVAISRVGFSFTLGILLRLSKVRWQKRCPKVPVHWLLLVCLGLLTPFPTDAWRVAYDLIFVSLASPFLVMLGTTATIRSGLKSCVGGLGLLSYPLYAVHAPVKHVIEQLLPVGPNMLLVTSSLSALGTAWLVATIDPVLRRWLATQLCRVRLAGPCAPSPAHGASSGIGVRP